MMKKPISIRILLFGLVSCYLVCKSGEIKFCLCKSNQWYIIPFWNLFMCIKPKWLIVSLDCFKPNKFQKTSKNYYFMPQNDFNFSNGSHNSFFSTFWKVKYVAKIYHWIEVIFHQLSNFKNIFNVETWNFQSPNLKCMQKYFTAISFCITYHCQCSSVHKFGILYSVCFRHLAMTIATDAQKGIFESH